MIDEEPASVLSYAEAARLLGRSETWLQRQVRYGTVPHRRLGRSVGFTREDIAAIIERSYQAPERSVQSVDNVEQSDSGVLATTTAHSGPLTPPASEDSDSVARLVPRLLLTTSEAAQVLGIGRRKLYELLNARDIESVYIGRHHRIPVDALTEYVARLRT